MEGGGMGSPMTEKRRAGIAKVKELWRQKGKGGNVDKKAWTIFLSSGRSFEELFLGDSSDSSSDDNSHHDQYSDSCPNRYPHYLTLLIK
jgi:hypothetical protein